jgi:hypothetical protein
MSKYPDPSQVRGYSDVLSKFLEEQNIEYSVTGNDFGNSPRTYTITVMPKYLDKTEERVVKFCEEQGIKYTFYATLDGMHHYEFSQGIFIDSGKEHVINFPMMIDIRNAYIQESARKAREEIELEMLQEDGLQTCLNPPTVKRNNWFQKAKNKIGDICQSIAAYNPKKLAAQKLEIDRKTRELLEGERRVKDARYDLLVLSGIMEEDEIVDLDIEHHA